MKDLVFDLSDIELSRKQMTEYGDTDTPFFGRNDSDELTITSVFPDRIATETRQNNGWTRTNILYRDGTCEELFDRSNKC